MTQADKDLLLNDLCGRLPYGVKVKFGDSKPALMVDYYDDEYCMNATYFCDYIEQVNTFTI